MVTWELNQRLAGLLSNDEATMTDTLFGYQALAGVDYQVSEPSRLGSSSGTRCSVNSRTTRNIRGSVGMRP